MEKLKKYMESEEVMSFMESVCDKNGKMRILNEDEANQYRQIVDMFKKYKQMSTNREQ